MTPVAQRSLSRHLIMQVDIRGVSFQPYGLSPMWNMGHTGSGQRSATVCVSHLN